MKLLGLGFPKKVYILLKFEVSSFYGLGLRLCFVHTTKHDVDQNLWGVDQYQCSDGVSRGRVCYQQGYPVILVVVNLYMYGISFFAPMTTAITNNSQNKSLAGG